MIKCPLIAFFAMLTIGLALHIASPAASSLSEIELYRAAVIVGMLLVNPLH